MTAGNHDRIEIVPTAVFQSHGPAFTPATGVSLDAGHFGAKTDVRHELETDRISFQVAAHFGMVRVQGCIWRKREIAVGSDPGFGVQMQ